MTWDVVVVGAGPGGLAAARECARGGLFTLLLDEADQPGGQIWRAKGGKANPLATLPANAEFRPSTTVFDAGPGWLRTLCGGTSEDVRWRHLILATGARELFLPFPGWTLPGVMGAGGLQAMAKGGLPVAGKRILLSGTGPLLLAVAAWLAAEGAEVVQVCEQAPLSRVMPWLAAIALHPAKASQGLAMARDLPPGVLRFGAHVASVEMVATGVKASIRRGHRSETVQADYVGVGYGLVPNTELATLLGCTTIGAPPRVVVDDRQATSVPEVFAVGEAVGIGGHECAEVEGEVAAAAILGEPLAALQRRRSRERRLADTMNRAFALGPALGQLTSDRTTVCRCEDVPWGSLSEFDNWREAKLQTRCGMGLCQGRICGAALWALRGFGPDQAKPPLVPVPAEHLAEPTEGDR